LPLDEINRDCIDKIVQEKLVEGVANSTVNRALALIRSIKVGDVYQSGKLLDLLSLSKEQTKGEKQRDLSLSNKQVKETLKCWIAEIQETYPR